MEELQRYRSSRKGYRAHLTRLIAIANDLMATNTDGLTDESIKTTTALDSLLGQLHRKETLLADLDTKILQLINDEDELETEVFEAEEIQSKIAETVSSIKSCTARLLHRGDEVLQPESPTHPKSKLPEPTVVTRSESPLMAISEATHTTERNESLQTLSDSIPQLPPPPNDSTLTNRGQVATRLPKLTIPMFGGDPLDWQPFWDSFEAAIHSNTQLNGTQKLSYLRAQLCDDAAQAIAGLSLTSTSYEHSIEVLKKRFGQSHILVSSHMQALIDLSSPTNTLEDLRRFHDLIESHIHSLTSLGRPTNTYSAMLVPFLLRKLPVDTIKNLTREHESSEWTIEELQEALLKEIRIFETSLHAIMP